MNPGELPTRLTVWVALLAYAIGAGMLLTAAGRSDRTDRARIVWTIGCAFFLAHVLCAFGFYHHWSHAEAYLETARQTAEMTGMKWGGGVFFNYVFAAAWLADVLWWWLDPASFARRPKWLTVLWQGYFAFMVFNGAVVFGHGPVRWLGVVIFACLACLWRRNLKQTWRQRHTAQT